MIFTGGKIILDSGTTVRGTACCNDGRDPIIVCISMGEGWREADGKVARIIARQ